MAEKTGEKIDADGIGIVNTNTEPNLQEYDEEQVRLMEERCIKVDVDDRYLGDCSKKESHLWANIESKGLLHRAFSCFLFDSAGRLLLQKRASTKITFPNLWTNTCCSHPLAISSEWGNRETNDLDAAISGAKNAAIRKLDHELGINKNELPIDKFQFLGRIHYKAASDGIWGEHEIDYLLFIRSDVHLNINKNEVEEFMYVTKDELMSLLKDQKMKFTPWFKLICEHSLFKWWDNLDTLSEYLQSDDALSTINDIQRLI